MVDGAVRWMENMREILFRGKRVDNNKWIYGSLISLDADSGYVYICENYEEASTLPPIQLIRLNTHLVEKETVGQYTGLRDKKEKIFDGDIMSFEAYGKNYIGKVCFVDGNCGIDCGNAHPFCDDAINRRDAVKIGNIHDNPELLERKLD